MPTTLGVRHAGAGSIRRSMAENNVSESSDHRLLGLVEIDIGTLLILSRIVPRAENTR